MEFKVGDNFIIKSRPSLWNSRCKNIDIRYSVTYPYKSKIIKIYTDEYGEISISCQEGGWSLSTLIKEDLITKVKALNYEIYY